MAGTDPRSASGRTILRSRNVDMLLNGNIETKIFNLGTIEGTRQFIPVDAYAFRRPRPTNDEPYDRGYWVFDKAALDDLREQQFPEGDYPADVDWNLFESQ